MYFSVFGRNGPSQRHSLVDFEAQVNLITSQYSLLTTRFTEFSPQTRHRIIPRQKFELRCVLFYPIVRLSWFFLLRNNLASENTVSRCSESSQDVVKPVSCYAIVDLSTISAVEISVSTVAKHILWLSVGPKSSCHRNYFLPEKCKFLMY